jgi:hypothetical protein
MDESRIKEHTPPTAKEPTMPASEARILANRANAARSTGPKTPEGKEQSRRNGLKHGMTGQGIVITEVDEAEVERRDAALRAELAPKSVIGAILVGQMATLSIRMERGAKQEFATVASRVRNAADDFDEARLAKAGELLNAIGDDPRGNLRKLLKSPEGVDLMIEAWQDLRADLTREPKPFWTASHLVQTANLLGLREEDARGSRIGVLSRAIWGDFEALADHEGGDLKENARKAWARGRLVEGIDEEIAALKAHVETLDFEIIEQDRAEAGTRALFDPSKEASLARRYESEARRGFFKALKEFHQAEAEAAERVSSAPTPATPSPRQSYGSMASSWEQAPTISRGFGPASETASQTSSPMVSRDIEVAQGAA